ncbi:hypothetical protein Bbelb_073920 [Branchiostoma belcheri]|nr:hypothetical protein Bbelb_073920 [Branchiostoma belcheri]
MNYERTEDWENEVVLKRLKLLAGYYNIHPAVGDVGEVPRVEQQLPSGKTVRVSDDNAWPLDSLPRSMTSGRALATSGFIGDLAIISKLQARPHGIMMFHCSGKFVDGWWEFELELGNVWKQERVLAVVQETRTCKGDQRLIVVSCDCDTRHNSPEPRWRHYSYSGSRSLIQQFDAIPVPHHLGMNCFNGKSFGTCQDQKFYSQESTS